MAPNRVLPHVDERRDDRGFTVKQTARRLSCSDDHVRNMIAVGHLPAVRVPGIGRRAARIIVMSADLDRCIEQWKERP